MAFGAVLFIKLGPLGLRLRAQEGGGLGGGNAFALGQLFEPLGLPGSQRDLLLLFGRMEALLVQDGGKADRSEQCDRNGASEEM